MSVLIRPDQEIYPAFFFYKTEGILLKGFGEKRAKSRKIPLSVFKKRKRGA